MISDVQKEPSNETVLIRSMDEYLALKHGSGQVSSALAALFRDRYGDDCSALDCDQSADVVLAVLNAPTIVIPLCERHALQLHEEYADLTAHLPKLTPEAKALFPKSDDAAHSAHLTPRRDESELRDEDEPEGSPRSADER